MSPAARPLSARFARSALSVVPTLAALAALVAAAPAARAQTVLLGSVEPGPREIAVRGGSPYVIDLARSLADYGFVVKAAGDAEPARYAFTLEVDAARERCAETDSYVVTARGTLTDVVKHRDVATVQQRGADGPCGPMALVFSDLASAIGDVWMGQ